MLTLDDNNAAFQIQAFQPGMIQINKKIYKNSLILSATAIIADPWPPHSFLELKKEHFDPIMQFKPTILLLGTGSILQFPDIELYGELINHGVGVEIMDTRAACRTFNVLTAEQRNVIAALLIH